MVYVRLKFAIMGSLIRYGKSVLHYFTKWSIWKGVLTEVFTILHHSLSLVTLTFYRIFLGHIISCAVYLRCNPSRAGMWELEHQSDIVHFHCSVLSLNTVLIGFYAFVSKGQHFYTLCTLIIMLIEPWAMCYWG